MSRPPLLSVCFASYNYGRYLRQCLNGMLMQSFRDFEIVVTEDGSTDESRAILREYEQKDARLKVNYFPENRGLMPAAQDMLSRVTGKYLYCTAADDFVANKDFFQRAVTALERDPRPAGFYGICGIFTDELNKITGGMGTADAVGFNTPKQCCEGFLKCRSVVTSPSAIFRTDLWLGQGGRSIDELMVKLGPQVDYYLNHSLAFRHGMIYDKTFFACQRVYQAKTNYSANLQLWETAARYAEMERLLREDGCPDYPGIERDWLHWRSYWMMDTVNKAGHIYQNGQQVAA